MKKAIIVDGKKQCTKCGEWKSLDDFSNGAGVGGRHSWCKACKAAHQKTRNFPPVMEGTKVCSACGQEKDVKEFNEHKCNTDGRQSLCQACNVAYQKTRNFMPVMKGTKVCTKCGQEKDVMEFGKNKGNIDGRQSLCKACDAAATSEWQANNPEKVKAGRQRRRARLAGTEDDWYNRDALATMDAFGTEVCPYCGGPLENPHWDHFVPLSLNGASEIGNMVLVCGHCNQSKGDKLPQDFLPYDRYVYVLGILTWLKENRREVNLEEEGQELFG